MDLIDNYFDNGINVNIKYPTFCHLQSGLLQLPPSQARKVFCSAATNYPDRCNLPCLQPALSSTSLSSPLLPPPPGCRWLFASNSKFWSWHSRLLRESHAYICRLRAIRTRQPVLCYNWPLSSPLPAAATSSFHLALTLLSTALQQ